ncbi:MAG TPA: VCBS repeat-containing protein, partial [Chthoniobacteraceae bacterium]|nr:VCBS repeat-containing protein [Chthoniobacteraceae bacterium]
MPKGKPSPTLIASSIEPLEARIAPAAAVLELSSLEGPNGFKINGASGYSVSEAGDINRDGFDDLIIGVDGLSYVIFGKAGGFAASLNVATLDGSNGFKINGGSTVSAAGDINGDGFGDLIMGAPSTSPNGTGASSVVFGKASGFAASLNLSTLDGSNGFKITGEAAGDNSGTSVSAAGDVNGDGFGDLIIGAHLADPNGPSSGASYVVFGKGGAFAASLNLSTLDGSNGFQINGEA